MSNKILDEQLPRREEREKQVVWAERLLGGLNFCTFIFVSFNFFMDKGWTEELVVLGVTIFDLWYIYHCHRLMTEKDKKWSWIGISTVLFIGIGLVILLTIPMLVILFLGVNSNTLYTLGILIFYGGLHSYYGRKVYIRRGKWDGSKR